MCGSSSSTVAGALSEEDVHMEASIMKKKMKVKIAAILIMTERKNGDAVTGANTNDAGWGASRT